MKVFYLVLVLFSSPIDAEFFQCDPNRSCGCGSNNVEINARIIAGEEAIPYSWPMAVSIRYNLFHDGDFRRHACGGTILTDFYILTAASCLEEFIDDVQSANITIAAGIHRRSQPMQIVREVDRMIVHPNWTYVRRNDYDIALLHLSESLDIGMHSLITRTCLPPQIEESGILNDDSLKNAKLAVVGWGRSSMFGYDSDALRQTIISSIDSNSTECANQTIDSKRQFCTGTHRDSAGPCYGDFGGPIFQWKNDHWEQIGIASSISDICRKDSTVVYTRLAYYHDWIEESINETTDEITVTTTLPNTTTPPQIYHCDNDIVSCGCGRRNVQISDLNNYHAIPYSWSMIVSVRLNHQNKHSCSGTILSESYILTSASCLINASSMGITILAGIHNYSENTGISRRVDQVFIHPNYVGPADNHANDIAILHISEALDVDNNLFLSQICLPHRYNALPESIYYPSPGASLIVIGWGLMNCINETEEQLLQQTQVQAVTNSNKNCYVLEKHQDIQFCARFNDEYTVPCVRDPGSPIFEWIGNRWQQVGIATYGIDCGRFQEFGVYTRIIDYIDWIQSITKTSPITTSTSTTSIITTTISTTTRSMKPPELYRCNHTLTCGCGAVPVVSSPARIIGGENAVEYSWPMMVSIRWPMKDVHWCGGTILSNSFILTAAHCLYEYESNPPEHLTISVGLTSLVDARQIRRTADQIYIHPNYTGIGEDSRHDIALIRINESLPMGNNLFVTKTCIHPLGPMISNEEYIENGTRLTTIGWGRTEVFGPPKSNILQQVEVYAIDHNDSICATALTDPQVEFCAGLYEGGKDSCQGDSGGPIFRWTGHYWEQVGIVSHGDGCAEPGKPGIYTRLSYYYDWINGILQDNNEHLEPNLTGSTTTVQSSTSQPMPTSSTNTPVSTTSTNTPIPTTYLNGSTTTTTKNGLISTTGSGASDSHQNYFLLLVLSLFFNWIL